MANMTPRGQRVADQIQRELATLIQLEVSDPRVGMVSVTGVDVSRDLAHARVFVTVLNTPSASDEANDALSSPGDLDKLEVEENLKALNQAAGYLRTLLAKRLALRSVPKLQFRFSKLERDKALSPLENYKLSHICDEAELNLIYAARDKIKDNLEAMQESIKNF